MHRLSQCNALSPLRSNPAHTSPPLSLSRWSIIGPNFDFLAFILLTKHTAHLVSRTAIHTRPFLVSTPPPPLASSPLSPRSVIGLNFDFLAFNSTSPSTRRTSAHCHALSSLLCQPLSSPLSCPPLLSPRSVIGLNFDFLVFNLTKHTAYLVADAAMRFPTPRMPTSLLST
ncbi:unnamed protein product [Closterium sp. NIES-53]